METLDLKVICCDRSFKDFVLNLLKNDILAIEHDENITGSEVNCACPTLDGRIERMHRRAGDLFTVHLYMNPFLGLILLVNPCPNYINVAWAGNFKGKYLLLNNTDEIKTYLY